MNNSDWYLDQLGITQYVLRKPAAMKGEASINIADHIRLIVVAQSVPNDKIFYDILKAINISIENCLILPPAQLLMPIEKLDRAIWFIDETLPTSWSTSPVISDKVIITTVGLAQLALSANLKRQLWNTICQYEDYFHTN